MFQLTDVEVAILVSQNVIPSRKVLGGTLPYAFTQEGVAMLSSVLRSKQAVLVNINIMRTFVRMRELLATNKELARKVEKHDKEIVALYDYLQKLLEPTKSPKRRIGYIRHKG